MARLYFYLEVQELEIVNGRNGSRAGTHPMLALLKVRGRQHTRESLALPRCLYSTHSQALKNEHPRPFVFTFNDWA
jgi:hypothetical protein